MCKLFIKLKFMETEIMTHLKPLIAVMLAIITISCSAKQATVPQTVELAKPTQKQIDFADWEVGAFFH